MKLMLAVVLTFFSVPAWAQEINASIVSFCFEGAALGDITPSCLGQAANVCQAQGFTTTIGITQCIVAETEGWDDILNQQYKLVQADFANRGGVLSAGKIDLNDQLLKAQRAWIAFRDAECELAFGRWQDGSIRSVVHANCMMVMTARRALELRDMKGN